MKTNTYVVHPSGNAFCFKNKKTGSENESFDDISSGTKNIMDMFFDKHIDGMHAYELFEQVTALPVPVIQIKEVSTREILDVFEETIQKLKITHTLLAIAATISKSDTNPLFIPCHNCGKHGTIIGVNFETKGFITSLEITSKHQGSIIINRMLEEKVINKKGADSLFKQLDESKMPDTSELDEIFSNSHNQNYNDLENLISIFGNKIFDGTKH